MLLLQILAASLLVLASIYTAVLIMRTYQEAKNKKDKKVIQEQEAMLETLDKQAYEQGCDALATRGRLAAREDMPNFLDAQSRLAEGYERADVYAEKHPCLFDGYQDNLAQSFSDGYAKEQKKLQGVQRPPQSTTGRMMPLAGTMLHSLVNKETA